VIASEELAASAWKLKWKRSTCSETGSYESTGGARKGCISGKAGAFEPQLARAGEERDWSSSSWVAP
jgi:hypothetical protein